MDKEENKEPEKKPVCETNPSSADEYLYEVTDQPEYGE